jgi:hypothetical protein
LDVDRRVRRREEATVTTLIATTTSLTASDRCDRCGAQAYIRVVMASGGELLFCAHHGRQYELKLREIAHEYHDETARLSETPATAPDGER